MQAEDRSSRTRRSSRSSVWIDPAYIRHNFTGEQGDLSLSPHTAMGGEEGLHGVSTWSDASFAAPRTAYRQPNPITPTPPTLDGVPGMPSPIPPRASAYRGKAPRLPSPVWQYDSPDYEIESSIAALSLAVPAAPVEPAEAPASAMSDPFAEEAFLLAEQPTHPEMAGSTSALAELPTRPEMPANTSMMAELPTHPEHRAGRLALAELDTVPPPLVLSADRNVAARPDPNRPTQALIPAHPTAVGPRPTRKLRLSDELQQPGLASWTAGGAEQSRLAHRLIERPARRGSAYSSSSLQLNPLDRVRWWLLKPGRIEFLLWLVGTILLIVGSLALLLATSLSFGWLAIGPLSRFSSSNNAHPLPTVVTYPGLKLTLLDKEPFLPGQSIHLRGQGFTPHGDVFFTYDHMQPLTSQGNMSAMARADAHGVLSVTLVLGTGQQWYAGVHLIEARDLVTGHLAAVHILIAIPASQNGGTTTNAPASVTPSPKGTLTPVPGSGNQPTPGPGPGGQTPVPITPTPTVGLTPTPTPTTTPSPTPTTTPSPTPTTTPTATPSPTPGAGATPTPTP